MVSSEEGAHWAVYVSVQIFRLKISELFRKVMASSRRFPEEPP
jgi:hypothetical protein